MQQVVNTFLGGRGGGKGVLGGFPKFLNIFNVRFCLFFYLLLRSVAANVTCFYALSARTLLRSLSLPH